MRIYSFLSIVVITTTLFSCQSNSGGGGATDLSAYTTENLGGGVTRAYKIDNEGKVTEEGFLSNGVKNGVWLVYFEGDNSATIKTLSSYSNGTLTGPVLEFSNRGQIDARKGYANNALNGLSAAYKFGKPESETYYKNGKLDGTFKEYRDGKVIKEIEYSDGKKNGKLIYYDADGNVSVEYVYKNDEKVSGGMIEKE